MESYISCNSVIRRLQVLSPSQGISAFDKSFGGSSSITCDNGCDTCAFEVRGINILYTNPPPGRLRPPKHQKNRHWKFTFNMLRWHCTLPNPPGLAEQSKKGDALGGAPQDSPMTVRFFTTSFSWAQGDCATSPRNLPNQASLGTKMGRPLITRT